MKFSTLVRGDSSYRLYPGATFYLEQRYKDKQSFIHPNRAVRRYYPDTGPGVLISDELLVSSDALVRHYIENESEGKYPWSRFEVTLVRAALRLGAEPVLVPESEAARCEIQQRAHAVLILGAQVEFSVEKSPIAGRRLMPNLFALVEGDVIDFSIVERGRKDSGVFRVGTPFEHIVEQCQLTFDGTNLKLTGAHLEHLSQECLV